MFRLLEYVDLGSESGIDLCNRFADVLSLFLLVLKCVSLMLLYYLDLLLEEKLPWSLKQPLVGVL